MLGSTRPRLRGSLVVAGLLLPALANAAPGLAAPDARTAVVAAVDTTPAAAGADRTPGQARYTVRLHQRDRAGRRWRGSETISFRNTSPTTLDQVQLRLWANGPDGCSTSRALVVSRLRGGTPEPPAMGCTDLTVDLAHPVAPGAAGVVAMRVSITAPVRKARFGSWHGRSYLTNALPILAVRADGAWQRHPYVADGESFSSLTARWDVHLDHPRGLAVPATGSVVGRRVHGDRVTTHVRAARVRDFAWAAGRFSVVRGTARDGTVVREWFTAHDSRREALRSLRREALPAMNRFGRWFGDYPYREVDVVDVDWRLGGMEYPGFALSALPGPTVHEIAHQWFYGLVGNDEYADPWLDESFAQYANFRFYGGYRSSCAGGPAWQGDERLTDGMDRFRHDRGLYYSDVYATGPCALLALREKLGHARFDTMLRRYVADHEYGVATDAEFKAAAQAAAGATDMTRFWRRWRIDG